MVKDIEPKLVQDIIIEDPWKESAVVDFLFFSFFVFKIK